MDLAIYGVVDGVLVVSAVLTLAIVFQGFRLLRLFTMLQASKVVESLIDSVVRIFFIIFAIM
jgi:hypothetical protein